MKKFGLAILASFFLLSCDESKVGKDGYTFGQPEYTKTEIDLKVVIHPDLKYLNESAKATGVKVPDNRKLMAYATIQGDTCIVHIVDATKNYMPEFIGHEASHCIWGRWHP